MKSLKRIRNRHKRCFELCAKAMRDEPHPQVDGFTLVHGRVCLGILGLHHDHAWIETGDGRIYDAVSNTYEPAADYMARHKAIVDRRYTRREFCETASATGHSGPWHGTIEDTRRRLSPEDQATLAKLTPMDQAAVLGTMVKIPLASLADCIEMWRGVIDDKPEPE